MTSYKSNDTKDPITNQYIVGLSCPDAFDKASPNDLMANGNDVLNSKELNSNYNLPKVPINLCLGTPWSSSSKVTVQLVPSIFWSSSSNVTVQHAPGTFRFNFVKINLIP